MATHSADIHEHGRGSRPDSTGTGAYARPIGALSRGHRTSSRQRQTDLALERGLGWLSLGLGAGGLFAPSLLGPAIGLPGQKTLLQVTGARELLAGAGLMSRRNAKPWLWARVAGDVMDLAVLGLAAARAGNSSQRRRSSIALGVVAAVTAVDAVAAVRASRNFAVPRQTLRSTPSMSEGLLGESITINKSPLECYEFWRKLEQLPQFMWTLESVTALDERRSHWTVCSAGTRIEWDAEVTHDVPGEQLAWHSLPNSQIAHAGVVRFAPAPGGRGTIVRVVAHYRLLPEAPPVSRLARILTNAPNARLREELRRFKQLLETGEIATTEGQPHGPRSLLGKTLQSWSTT